MIRITGGKHRSRKLATPETNLTKPTMDKVRAGVFNALGNHLDGKVVLDLFAGSGSYGFESLSRGASFVDFVLSFIVFLISSAYLCGGLETLL